MESIFRKKKTADGKKVDKSLVTKVGTLLSEIMNTDQENSKVRNSYFELKSIAKSIGHPSLFAPKRQPTPKKTPRTHTT